MPRKTPQQLPQSSVPIVDRFNEAAAVMPRKTSTLVSGNGPSTTLQ